MKHFITMILCLLPALSAVAAKVDSFEYGPRPPLSIFDPDSLLDPQFAKEIAGPLAAYKKDGIDVMVVVLKDLGSAPPEHVAKGFANAWCDSPIHCVVLHVPGRADSPWLVPDGELTDYLVPDQVRQAVADSQRRAAAEPDDAGKVKVAATEAADLLRYWFATALNRSEDIQTLSSRMRAESEAKKFKLKMITMMAPVVLIALIVGIALLVAFFRRRGPAYFSHVNVPARLGAPHAGGNNAVTNLGHPLP